MFKKIAIVASVFGLWAAPVAAQDWGALLKASPNKTGVPEIQGYPCISGTKWSEGCQIDGPKGNEEQGVFAWGSADGWQGVNPPGAGEWIRDPHGVVRFND